MREGKKGRGIGLGRLELVLTPCVRAGVGGGDIGIVVAWTRSRSYLHLLSPTPMYMSIFSSEHINITLSHSYAILFYFFRPFC